MFSSNSFCFFPTRLILVTFDGMQTVLFFFSIAFESLVDNSLKYFISKFLFVRVYITLFIHCFMRWKYLSDVLLSQPLLTRSLQMTLAISFLVQLSLLITLDTANFYVVLWVPFIPCNTIHLLMFNIDAKLSIVSLNFFIIF